jgi:iron complex transport system permease protein
MAVGSVTASPRELWLAFQRRGDPLLVNVLWLIRIPRALLAILVGAALAMSGAALQAALRNPLAEPYLLGVSGGAAVGAVLAVLGGVAAAFMPVAAFAGAIAAVSLALFVSRSFGQEGPRRRSRRIPGWRRRAPRSIVRAGCGRSRGSRCIGDSSGGPCRA